MTKESSKKNWRGKVAKQWKRMQGSSSAPNTSYPEGGSIGVPLEDCPMCPDLECVPLLVRTCCKMVEDKGLDIVGIYRVPGNSAAVNALTEQVLQDIRNQCRQLTMLQKLSKCEVKA